MENKTRVCNLCKDELPLTTEYFYRKGLGFQLSCKICSYVCHLRYLYKNKEKVKQFKRNYYLKNRDAIIREQREKRKQNKEETLKKRRRHSQGFIKFNSNVLSFLSEFYDVRKDPKNKVLGQIRCDYCGEYFNPTYNECTNRRNALKNFGGNRLYCSDNCKQSCPTYGQISYPKGFKKASSREVNTVLRKIVLERDGYKCQKCGDTTKETQLHVHHIKSYTQNTMFKDDPDNCITLCKKCHKQIHKQDGCKYQDLRCA